MEPTFIGRNITLSDRFREYATEKLAKVEALTQRAQGVDVKVTKHNSHSGGENVVVEITVEDRHSIIRAEAQSADKFAAFDLAYSKLMERLRRMKDRKKIHRGRHKPVSVSEATADLVGLENPAGLGDSAGSGEQAPGLSKQEGESNNDDGTELLDDDSPVLIRRKVFPAQVMNVDDAVDNMELVGHDFYLFLDAESKLPSVVYRRRGWTYGVICLTEEEDASEQVLPYRASRTDSALS